MGKTRGLRWGGNPSRQAEGRRGGMGRTWYCRSSLIHREGPGPTAAATRPTAPVTTLSLLLFLSIPAHSSSLCSCFPLVSRPSPWPSTRTDTAACRSLPPGLAQTRCLSMQVSCTKCCPATHPLNILCR